MTALGVLTANVTCRRISKTLSLWSAVTVNTVPSTAYRVFRRPLPGWKGGSNATVLLYGDGGRLEGKLTKNNVPVAGAKVYLFYRPTMALMGVAISDAIGDFKFGKNGTTVSTQIALDPTDLLNYLVIATDASNTYNAVVLDMLTAST